MFRNIWEQPRGIYIEKQKLSLSRLMSYEQDIQRSADEIINGKGYVVLPNIFSKEEIKEAKDLINKNMEILLEEAGAKSATQGEYDDKKERLKEIEAKGENKE